MNTTKTSQDKTSASNDNPISSMFKDMFNNFKIPGLDLENIYEHSRANFESLMKANQIAASGLTEMGKHQVEIFRQTLDQAMNIAKHSFEEMTHEQRLAKQTELAKMAFEKAVSNAKELADIASKSGKEASEVLQERIKTSLAEIQKFANQNKA